MNASTKSFALFVSTAEAVGKTTKRNEKVGLIAELLRSLSLEDASLAAQYLTGRTFAQFEERVTGVGGNTLVRAISRASGKDAGGFAKLYRKHGDLGDMAEELLRESRKRASISMGDVATLFDQLSASRAQSQKDELLHAFFSRASAPEVKYIVKILTGDLRIGSKESLVEDAIARAFERNVAEVRRANMLKGDIGEVLLLAANDRLSEASITLFHPLGAMLATPVETAEEIFAEGSEQAVFVEYKFDGIRGQVHKNAEGKVKIYSRTRDEVGEFPELVQELAKLPGEMILDGEILGWREGRPLPFTELQKRLGRKQIDMWLPLDIPVKFIAFDILFIDGKSLLDEPLSNRKEMASELLARASDAVLLAPIRRCKSAEEVRVEFRAALDAGHEGIVAKTTDSVYSPGRRGGSWMKLKEPFATLDVVVTAAEYGHGKRHAVLSDVTFAVRDGERFLNIGKAYSGLTDAEIGEFTKFFLEHTVEDQGFRRIVEPKLVLEVAFNNIQVSKRHESGFALRFPRIVRARQDKPPNEIDTLDRVKELFHAQGKDSRRGEAETESKSL